MSQTNNSIETLQSLIKIEETKKAEFEDHLAKITAVKADNVDIECLQRIIVRFQETITKLQQEIQTIQ